MPLDIVLSLIATCSDSAEILHLVIFHLGLHCLPKHLFAGIKNKKGKAYIYYNSQFFVTIMGIK